MDSVARAGEVPGFGGSLAASLLTLGLVCLLAWVTLRWLARRGIGQGRQVIRVVARCPLDARRSVYVVEAAGRNFLLGAGEGGLSLLAELDAAAVGAAPVIGPPAPGKFADVLARVLGKPPQAGG